jgi:hypothetical protein
MDGPMQTSPPAPELFRWHFAPALAEALRERLSSGRWADTAVVLKENRRRVVYRVPGTPGLIVKYDRAPRPIDRVKALWRHPGQREYEAGQRALARGLPVPASLGFARRGAETLFAALELPACESLQQAWLRAQVDGAWRRRLLAGLAHFAQTFAAARVRHPDMHAGNILVRDLDPLVECWLVDLAGAQPLAPGARFAVWDAAGWMTQLAPAIAGREVRHLLQAAAVAPSAADPLLAWWPLLRRAGHEAARRWPGRRARLLQSSSLCQTVDTSAGRWRLSPPFPLETAQEAWRQHQANVAAERLLKRDRKRRLSRVEVAGRTLVVKEFVTPGTGTWRSDRRSWLNHYRLGPEAFRVCRCYAWLQAPQRGVLILEDVGAGNLPATLQTAAPAARRELLVAAVRLIAALHAAGTVPRDMKATNVVAADPGAARGSVCLVDADALCFDVTVSLTDRAANLRQFLENLPAVVTRWERLRTLVAYRQASGLSLATLRRLLGRLIRI